MKGADTDWTEFYLLTALRLHKLLQEKHGELFLDCYYGPMALKARVMGEKTASVERLQEDVGVLADSLAGLAFAPERVQHLQVQLGCMKATLRWFKNESLVWEEEVKAFFGIKLSAIPDSHFDEGLKWFDKALPGRGGLRSRFARWQKTNRQVLEPSTYRKILESSLYEVRKRAHERFSISRDEAVEFHLVTKKRYGAANWYQGGFKSVMEFNADRPVDLFNLLPLVCHEGYLGHHVEYCLKEEHIFREKGLVEQGAVITLCPQLFISEGIAEKAFEIIFDVDESAECIQRIIFDPLAIKLESVDLPSLVKASNRNRLDQVSSAMVYLLHSGKSQREIIDYAVTYSLQEESLIKELYEEIAKSHFRQLYLLSYWYGKNMVSRFVAQGNPIAQFNRLLTERLTLSDLSSS